MKETNMEHFRSAIEEMEYNFSLCDGAIRKCSYCAPCADCAFDDNIESCTTIKIKWLMSEYKEEPVLTAREKHFVEFAETGWLARDMDGVLNWFMRIPDRNEEEDYRCWNGPVHVLGFKKLHEIFPFITWDEEPWSVADLRKLKALEYNPEDVAFKGGANAD